MSEIAASSREIIRKGSKSFAAAARLFDAETRNDVYLLYAWCRYCDDLIDGQEMGFGREEISPADAEARLAHLRREAIDVVILDLHLPPDLESPSVAIQIHEAIRRVGAAGQLGPPALGRVGKPVRGNRTERPRAARIAQRPGRTGPRR